MKKIAERVTKLPVFYFAALAPKLRELVAEGMDVIRLDIGSPDLPPPAAVLSALAESAFQSDRHGYVPQKGIPALREAWAVLYKKRFGVELDTEREIVPLLGSKEGIFHLTQAFAEEGDVVLVPDPGYVTYASAALFSGAEPYFMPLRPEKGFLPDLGAIPEDVARRAKILWLNYPNNPTGAVATSAFFEQACAFAVCHDLLLCHDAAYTQVTFEGFRASSALEVKEAEGRIVEFNTLSKSHNMAGWRVGVAVGDRQVLETLYRLKTHADSGHFLPIHEAAIIAMTGDQDWIASRNAVYQRRRDLLAEALVELGADFERPLGGLYIWCACPEGWTSLRFAEALLEEAGVSVAPGVMFGAQGEGYVRISLCVPEERLCEAAERLREWWRKEGRP
jgi:LL-diaminopimelate aminotransferase